MYRYFYLKLYMYLPSANFSLGYHTWVILTCFYYLRKSLARNAQLFGSTLVFIIISYSHMLTLYIQYLTHSNDFILVRLKWSCPSLCGAD